MFKGQKEPGDLDVDTEGRVLVVQPANRRLPTPETPAQRQRRLEDASFRAAFSRTPVVGEFQGVPVIAVGRAEPWETVGRYQFAFDEGSQV